MLVNVTNARTMTVVTILANVYCAVIKSNYVLVFYWSKFECC
jgi:hypothetical protein